MSAIAPMHPAEADLCPAIEDAAATLFAGILAVDPGTTPVARIAAAAEAGAAWLARVDARPAGFLYGAALPEGFYIQEISVDPAFGRRGLGGALMAAAEAGARAGAQRALWLTTFRDIPWNAPWYARLGFAPAREDAFLPAALARDLERQRARYRPARLAMRKDLPG